MKENEEIEKKQEFLRKNIIDKGYDPNNFIDFITNIRGEEGKNIEHWKYESLIVAVDDYHKKMNPQKEENINNIITNDEQINEIEVNLEKNKNKNEEKIKKDNNSEFFICKQLEKNKMSEIDDCYASLKFIKKNDGWLFSTPTIEFEIEVKKLNLKVFRNNSDFNLLKTALEKTFFNKIFFNVPEINNDIEITRQNFERYLNHLLFDKLIKSSEILYDFLSIENKEEFDLKFNYYSKINFENNLEKIRTLDGKLEKDINEEKENLYLNLKDNINLKKDLINQLNKAFFNFNNYNTILQKQINEIICIFSQLKNNSIKFFEGNTQVKLYSFFYNSFINIKYFIEKINIENFEKLKNYCDYFSKQFDSFNNFFYYKLDTYHKNYKFEYNNLISLKEKHFKNKDINLWNIEDIKSHDKIKLLNNQKYAFNFMFPEKTKSLEKTKDIYGIYLNQFINEYENFMKINSIELIKCYFDFCGKTFKVITDYEMDLNKMLNEVKSLPEYNIKLGIKDNLNYLNS